MVSQLRLAHRAGQNAIRHRRLLATVPPVVPAAPPLNANTTIPRPTPVPLTPDTPPPLATVPPIVTEPPLVGVPPPPPPPPRPPRRLFRRIFILTALGVLTFYPVSGWLSTQNETYRDFFVTNIPGGEAVADYADDHAWESFGFGTVSKKAVEGWQKVTGDDKKIVSRDRVGSRARELERDVKSGVKDLEDKAESAYSSVKAKASDAADKAKAKAAELADRTKSAASSTVDRTRSAASDAASRTKSAAEDVADKARSTASQAASKAKQEGERVKSAAEREASRVESKTSSFADRAVEATHQATDKAAALAAAAKDKIAEATSNVPFNFSEGVEGMVREAERALTRGEDKVGRAVDRVEGAAHRAREEVDATPGSGGFLDAQRPRDVDTRNVKPAKPTYEGQEVYTAPLPLGFEPPPGYYIAPPPKTTEPVQATLPLLVPKVKDFAASEPIISQLASTIDSLTQSLSTPTSSNPNGILTKAHDDLSALSQRLDEVKQAEKERLEKTLAEKASEFQDMLRGKDEERAQGEQGLKQTWETERRKMVDEWRGALETELESQRQGIEQRLREEVVSQGIELQRRWLRSIKSQVETERGGRLAKLDTLTTSLKQLERITMDNSATLDDNVRLHKVWSALRAVQAKAESGDVAFDDELRVLKSLSSDPLASTTLAALEQSGIPQSGVKSYAALSSWFSQSVAPRCQSASLVPEPENATVLSHLASATISKIMFSPKAGLVQGDDVAAVLARAEWCLGKKDLDGAAREVNSLKGWPGKLAGDWLREARRRLEVMQALEIVGTEASLGTLKVV